MLSFQSTTSIYTVTERILHSRANTNEYLLRSWWLENIPATIFDYLYPLHALFLILLKRKRATRKANNQCSLKANHSTSVVIYQFFDAILHAHISVTQNLVNAQTYIINVNVQTSTRTGSPIIFNSARAPTRTASDGRCNGRGRCNERRIQTRTKGPAIESAWGGSWPNSRWGLVPWNESTCAAGE